MLAFQGSIYITFQTVTQTSFIKTQSGVVVVVVVFVVGVRGKPRMYYSLLAYCTARFGRSNFGHQMPPRLPTRSAL
jgi:hypothetical protein